jgi:hypothetical protein
MNLPNGKVGLYSIVLLLIGSRTVAAQTITISGAQTSGLTVSAVSTPGAQPNAVSSTDGSTTYTCVTPSGGGNPAYRITAALTAAMPTGTTLRIKLTAPLVGGTSAGLVTLSTTPANVVTAIPAGKTCAATAIQYQLSALASAGIITSPGNTRSVTFRILTP